MKMKKEEIEKLVAGIIDAERELLESVNPTQKTSCPESAIYKASRRYQDRSFSLEKPSDILYIEAMFAIRLCHLYTTVYTNVGGSEGKSKCDKQSFEPKEPTRKELRELK